MRGRLGVGVMSGSCREYTRRRNRIECGKDYDEVRVVEDWKETSTIVCGTGAAAPAGAEATAIALASVERWLAGKPVLFGKPHIEVK